MKQYCIVTAMVMEAMGILLFVLGVCLVILLNRRILRAGIAFGLVGFLFCVVTFFIIPTVVCKLLIAFSW